VALGLIVGVALTARTAMATRTLRGWHLSPDYTIPYAVCIAKGERISNAYNDLIGPIYESGFQPIALTEAKPTRRDEIYYFEYRLATPYVVLMGTVFGLTGWIDVRPIIAIQVVVDALACLLVYRILKASRAANGCP
jgi:hypothetical protein